MKDFLFGWVRDIAFYTLLMVVVLHVLPEKSQRKYLQFFMGVVMIILVLSPVLKFTGLEGHLDETYVWQTYDWELQEFHRRQEELEARYQVRIEEQIKEAQEEIEAEQMEEGEVVENRGTSREGTDIGVEGIRVEIGTLEED